MDKRKNVNYLYNEVLEIFFKTFLEVNEYLIIRT
jgi:hypothetical protein